MCFDKVNELSSGDYEWKVCWLYISPEKVCPRTLPAQVAALWRLNSDGP
jgi:hypothetical protein